MLSGKYRSAWRRFAIFDVSPSMPDLKTDNITRYGFESGATDRTSTRIDRSLPIGIRIIDPRSTADALIWLGASKCGSSRRYAFTLELSSRQMSFPCVRMRSTNFHPRGDSFSCPFGAQSRFLPPLLIEPLVCIPLPFTPTTGFGKNDAVIPSLVATCRQISLYNWI